MKTQTQHTHGPWSIEAVKDYLRTHDTGIDSEISESIANAHLIAAAPDLLLALETLLSDRSCPSFLTLEEWRNTHPEFRETLRKARGEA